MVCPETCWNTHQFAGEQHHSPPYVCLVSERQVLSLRVKCHNIAEIWPSCNCSLYSKATLHALLLYRQDGQKLPQCVLRLSIDHKGMPALTPFGATCGAAQGFVDSQDWDRSGNFTTWCLVRQDQVWSLWVLQCSSVDYTYLMMMMMMMDTHKALID